MDHDEKYRFKQAIFERFTNGLTYPTLSMMFNISEQRLRRAYNNWISDSPQHQPADPNDIEFIQRKRGRPFALTSTAESMIKEAIEYYADNYTPLSIDGMRDLVEHYLRLERNEARKTNFKNARPSQTWTRQFLERHDLDYKCTRIIEESRLSAVTKEHCAEHLARIRSIMLRYRIRDSRFIFNLDQSGASFQKMVGRSLRKGIGRKGVKLIQKAIRTKGGLNRVTVMPVVSAAGLAYKPIVVYPGKRAHYRIVRGVVQTVQSFLPPCYF